MAHAEFDEVMVELVDYAYERTTFDNETLRLARYCLLDSIGCAIAASADHDCLKLMGSAQFSKSQAGVPVVGTGENIRLSQTPLARGNVNWNHKLTA